jgi:prefoldin alpha subunit
MVNEEYILRLSMFEQEMNKLQEKMQVIDQQINELQNLQYGLQELDKSNEKEMMANLGKGIFIKTNIVDKNLLVDVGNNTFVNKNIPQTIEIIQKQLKSLDDAKNRVIQKIQEIQAEAMGLVEQVQKAQEQQESGKNKTK